MAADTTKKHFIRIRGANVNNLKNLSVDIPRDKFVVFTGLSGSGKSSLAFDTIYAEGQYSEKESVSDRRSVTLSESVLPRNPHSCKETRRIPGRKQQKIQFPRQNNLRYDDWDFWKLFLRQ